MGGGRQALACRWGKFSPPEGEGECEGGGASVILTKVRIFLMLHYFKRSRVKHGMTFWAEGLEKNKKLTQYFL